MSLQSQYSLRAWLDWVEHQSDEGGRVQESVLPETDDDSVRIMTVHAAKGLEFPIVFVVNLSRGTGGRGDPVEVVTRGGDDGSPGEDLVSIDALVADARVGLEELSANLGKWTAPAA